MSIGGPGNTSQALPPAERARSSATQNAQVARDLEGEFARLLVGRMRESGFGDEGLFSGASAPFGDLFDRELSRQITAGRGLGLQEVILRQIGGLAAQASPPVPAPARASMPATAQIAALTAMQTTNQAAAPAPAPSPSAAARSAAYADHAADHAADHSADHAAGPQAFVARIWPHAVRAAETLGVPAKTLVAQAALETGWGRHLPKHADGSTSHNLFGIKAGSRWQGAQVNAGTQEFRAGSLQRENAAFRAYASPEESFADYVNLLRNSPRYAGCLDCGGDGNRYIAALQRAGYATDPQYAAKVRAIAEGPTLRRALVALSEGGGATGATGVLAARDGVNGAADALTRSAILDARA